MISMCPNDLSRYVGWQIRRLSCIFFLENMAPPGLNCFFCLFVFNVNTPTVLPMILEVGEAWSNTASIFWVYS